MDKNLSLDTIANGALKERFADELQKVLENIKDPNTEATKERNISVKLSFKPDKKRNQVGIKIECKSSTAAYETIDSVALLYQENQQMVLEEFKTGPMEGQTAVEEYESNEKVTRPLFKNAISN